MTSGNRKFQRTSKSRKEFPKNPPLLHLLCLRLTHRFHAFQRSLVGLPPSARKFSLRVQPRCLYHRVSRSLSLELARFLEPPGCARHHSQLECFQTHFSVSLQTEHSTQHLLSTSTSASESTLRDSTLILFAKKSLKHTPPFPGCFRAHVHKRGFGVLGPSFALWLQIIDFCSSLTVCYF